MNQEFAERIKEYFPDQDNEFLKKLEEPCTQGFFLNTSKGKREDILSLIDFPYTESSLTKDSFYHEHDNIGKTKAYELGLIYPQEIAASLTSSFVNKKNIEVIVDLCAAPGGKTINILNRIGKDVLCISNDVSHNRALVLSQNLERLGLDNVIITNKKCSQLAQQLEGCADIVILDAPCSGEGMIRKYPEILDEYSSNNILSLAKTQEELLENAYQILNEEGILIYSTCTYAFEEDEDQITDFLKKHSDMKLLEISMDSVSKLKGTVKLSPLNNTEGQFFCMLQKYGARSKPKFKYLKSIKEKLVDDFIKDNFDLSEYYLYKNNDHYYLSLKPLIDMGNNVLKYSIYMGEIINKRFEPNHNLYRANSLSGKYKYTYDLNDDEYLKYVSGNEIKTNTENNYYLVTYKNYSLGFGKCSNGVLKNKYPKGLRRMI